MNEKTVDHGYQRAELFLIGFATVVITFLWVGVFATIFDPQTTSYNQTYFHAAGSSPLSLAINSAQSVSEQLITSVKDTALSMQIAIQTLESQYSLIADTSCLVHRSCFAFLNVSQDGQMPVFASVAHVISGLLSWQLTDASEHVVSLALGQESTQTMHVLGEKAVSPEQLLNTGKKEFMLYMDTMTFGAISTIEPSLVEE